LGFGFGEGVFESEQENELMKRLRKKTVKAGKFSLIFMTIRLNN
jgi:hypothetical protein